MGKKRMEYFEFLTRLSDVQNAINSRYSGNVGLDIITPNAFNTAIFLRDPEEIHLTPPSREALLEHLEIRDLYLGRIMEVTPGDDDLDRSAKIRKSDGKGHVHSIKHLYPLELSITHSYQAVTPPDENSVSDVLAPSRPKNKPEECTKKIKTLYGIDCHESVVQFL